MSIEPGPQTVSRGPRDLRLAWIFFGGTFVALIFSGIWSMIVGTASPGADEKDLVQGWEGVLRNSPAYLLLIIVASLGVWFATRAGLQGVQRARVALVATSLVLLFALSSVTRDSSEVVMTTRAATVSWLTFGVDASIVAVVFLAARRKIHQASSR